MDDYRRIMLLASMQEERAKEVARLRNQAGQGPRPSLRTILVAVTVVLLGMVAWWGH